MHRILAVDFFINSCDKIDGFGLSGGMQLDIGQKTISWWPCDFCVTYAHGTDEIEATRTRGQLWIQFPCLNICDIWWKRAHRLNTRLGVHSFKFFAINPFSYIHRTLVTAPVRHHYFYIALQHGNCCDGCHKYFERALRATTTAIGATKSCPVTVLNISRQARALPAVYAISLVAK